MATPIAPLLCWLNACVYASASLSLRGFCSHLAYPWRLECSQACADEGGRFIACYGQALTLLDASC